MFVAIIRWTNCSNDPLAWIPFRELLLHVVVTPSLWLPAVALIVCTLTYFLHLSWVNRGILTVVALLLTSGLYSPIATATLSAWLMDQLPKPSLNHAPQAVLLGRGSEIASATTTLAAELEHQGIFTHIYVSGDERRTADRLVALGVPPDRVAGDSCARTTWENATRTTAWLWAQPSARPGVETGPSITLITDRWQLPRAALAFQRLGVTVVTLAAPLVLSPQEQNRLALRETAAMLLYRLQGRT